MKSSISVGDNKRRKLTWLIGTRAGFILLLIIQNLVVFRNHYFHDFGFPWDFANGYYAMTAFWTTLLGQGTYPVWMPYYSMGMPFDLLLQTGAHYPPLWIFPLFRMEYSLHAAVVIQCLHVFFGAVGMYFFIRLIFRSVDHANFYALCGAYAFQFFGGFYSNAQHVDIIRAFAFSPWFLYFFYITPSDLEKPGKRFYFIPGMILLLVTGGYPGNVVSTTVVVGLYFLFQAMELWRCGTKLSVILKFSFFVLFVSLLGVGLSFYHLGPAVFYKNFLVRNEQIGNFTGMAMLKFEHFPSFFLENTLVPGQISMTSSYVTLPVLILASMISWRILRQYWPVLGIFLFSLLMAFGPGSFLWVILTKIFPPLGYSRFPSSDYRIFIAIAIIFFATLSLQSLINRGLGFKTFGIYVVVILVWFSLGIYTGYRGLHSIAAYETIVIFLMTVLLLGVVIHYAKGGSKMVLGIVPVFLLLVSLDAFKVLSNMDLPEPQGLVRSTWQVSNFDSLYPSQGWELERNDQLATYTILRDVPLRRPPRIAKNSSTDFAWEGFINGRFTLNNYKSPNMLGSTSVALDDPLFMEYMLKAWTPLLIEINGLDTEESEIRFSPREMRAEIRLASEENLAHIQQVRYGVNEIEYRVTLSKPVLMVENEVYFPGWTASLVSDRGITSLRAVSVNDFFRAWWLPSGEYSMFARFEFPHSRVYNGVSIVLLIVWILLLLYSNPFPWMKKVE